MSTEMHAHVYNDKITYTVVTIVIETLFSVPLPDNYGFQMGIPIQKP